MKVDITDVNKNNNATPTVKNSDLLKNNHANTDIYTLSLNYIFTVLNKILKDIILKFKCKKLINSIYLLILIQK